MKGLLRIFSTAEPEPLTDSECDQAAIDALRRWGPMIDRHIRQNSPLGVSETRKAIERLQADGRIVQDADGRYRLNS
jgi:hypothetical protein